MADTEDVIKVLAVGGIIGGIWWMMSSKSSAKKIGQGAASDPSCDEIEIGSQSKNFEVLNAKIQIHAAQKPEHELANPLVVTDMFMREMLPYCPPTPPADHPAAHVFRETAIMTFDQMQYLNMPMQYESKVEMFGSLPAGLGY